MQQGSKPSGPLTLIAGKCINARRHRLHDSDYIKAFHVPGATNKSALWYQETLLRIAQAFF